MNSDKKLLQAEELLEESLAMSLKFIHAHRVLLVIPRSEMSTTTRLTFTKRIHGFDVSF